MTTSEREREIREQVEAGQLWKVDIQFLLAQLDAARLKIATLERKTVFCGGCGKTYQSPQDEDKHGFGKCVLKEGK